MSNKRPEAWIFGYGHYCDALYQVTDRSGSPVLALIAGMNLGSGGTVRRLVSAEGILVLPPLPGLQLPAIRFTEALAGYWRLGRLGAGLYAAELPEGAEEISTAGSAVP